MTKNSLVYARKSRGTEGQTAEEDLEKQRETLLLIAKNNNYNVLAVFEEVASSVDEEREQFNEMINMIQTKKVDVVLISAIDRVARSLGIFERFLQVCKDYNVLIETPREQIDLNNAGSELLALIQSVLAKSEYSQIKRRLAEGKVQAVTIKHRWIGSSAPFGYVYDRINKTLVPDESTKHIYRNMVELALEGYSFSQIAKEINDKGYRTQKGNLWTAGRILKILKNRTYLGEAEYNSTTVKQKGFAKDCHEPLITYEEYDKISKLGKDRRNYDDRQSWGNVKTILDDLIYCGKCHRKTSIFLQKTTASRTRKTPFYMARTCIHFDASTGIKCNNGGCKVDHIEEYVLDYLKDYQEQVNNELANIKNNDSSNVVEKINEKINSVKKDIKNNEESIKRLNRAYLAQAMELDEYTQLKNELSSIKENLEIELDSLDSQLNSLNTEKISENLQKRVDAISIILDNEKGTIEGKNAMLKTIIERIEFVKLKGAYGNPEEIIIYTIDTI